MNQLRSPLLITACVLYLVLVANLEALMAADIQTVAFLGTPIGIFSIYCTGTVATSKFWSASALYLGITFVFNIGQLVVITLGGDVLDPKNKVATEWIYGTQGHHAAVLASLCMLTFSIGAMLFATPRSVNEVRAYPEVKETVGRFGLLLLAGSIGAWALFSAVNGGIDVFTGTYANFLKTTHGGGTIGFFYWGIIFGLGLLATTNYRYTKIGFAIFGIWAADAFLIGLRGEVLMPVTMTIVVLAKQNRMKVGILRSLVLITLLLTVISIVKESRIHGLGSTDVLAAATPSGSLQELGASLRPTAEVAKAVEVERMPLRLGNTYYASFERSILYYLIPGMQRTDALDDSRLTNVWVGRRIGAAGFSTVAEAYMNFGFFGAQAVLFLIGGFLARVDAWGNDLTSLCWMMAVLQPLNDHIRQSFTPFFFNLALGVTMTCFVMLLVEAAKRRSALQSRLNHFEVVSR